MRVSVLIPAYNPDRGLLTLINSLIHIGFNHIIVVDDGSTLEVSKQIFDEIKNIEKCYVLIHEKNSGKGRALKTGLSYFSSEIKNDIGIVTSDCDGQHQVEDILNIAKELENNPSKLILGVRSFKGKVPFRSRFGNTVTKLAFMAIIGRKISDTQTGLRGIPAVHVPHFLKLDGEGYEYETNMLMSVKEYSIEILEKQIQTIYIENNQSSHFNPIIDSMKIYFVLFRFVLSSLIASLLDVVMFGTVYHFTANTLLSIFVGRFTIGPIANFTMNKTLVFHNKGNISATFAKYFIFATIMGISASYLIDLLVLHFAANIMLAKVIVEVFLFIISFKIQRDYIFTKKS